MTSTSDSAVTERPRLARATRLVLSSPYLHRMQRRHFLLFDVLPLAGTLCALVLAFFHPPTTVDLTLLAIMWLATGIGLTVGYHRFFSHSAFATSNAVAGALLILGSMAARGPMVSWVAMHRRHHELSDHDGDLHSPNLAGSGVIGRAKGWLHAHLTWMIEHDYPNVAHYTPELLRNPAILRVNRHYYVWVTLGLVLPALAGAALTQSPLGALTGLLWGGIVRMFVVEQTMSAVNSFAHLIGTRPYETRGDNSRNNPVIGLLAWGEGWHNNHHAFPYSAAFGLRWYQLDIGFCLIKAMESVGLVWNVRLPTADRVAQKEHRAEAT